MHTTKLMAGIALAATLCVAQADTINVVFEVTPTQLGETQDDFVPLQYAPVSGALAQPFLVQYSIDLTPSVTGRQSRDPGQADSTLAYSLFDTRTTQNASPYTAMFAVSPLNAETGTRTSNGPTTGIQRTLRHSTDLTTDSFSLNSSDRLEAYRTGSTYTTVGTLYSTVSISLQLPVGAGVAPESIQPFTGLELAAWLQAQQGQTFANAYQQSGLQILNLSSLIKPGANPIDGSLGVTSSYSKVSMSGNLTIKSVTVVPEPSSMILSALGLIGMGWVLRRRNANLVS